MIGYFGGSKIGDMGRAIAPFLLRIYDNCYSTAIILSVVTTAIRLHVLEGEMKENMDKYGCFS